jgi:LPXTG-motif cell wall-anchored protein
LKKLTMLVATMTMGLLIAAPAIAQVGQEGEQEGESGEVDQSFTVTGSGSNGNSCAPLQGSAQSGNSQNQGNVVQERSDSDDFEFDEVGSDIASSGSNSTECIQEVNQAASAAAAPKATPPPPPPPAPAPPPAPKAAPAPPPPPAPTKEEVKAEKAEVKAQKAEAKAQKAEAKKAKELPKTGGSGAVPLFALGAGTLLVAGGLLARRLTR